MFRRGALFVLVLFALFASGCKTLSSKTALDAAGPIDFDPSIPRIILPSRVRDSAAPTHHAASPLVTTATEIRGGGGREPTRFESIRIRGLVEGPLALTELHFTFRNLEDRTVETSFTVNLPANGAITRFAMKSGTGEWQEGRIAEAAGARQAYERLLQRGIDPGLVEIDGPDRVRVRLFPVAANQVWDVMLTVLSPLTRADEPFRLPLAGTAAASVDAQVLLITPSGKKVATYSTRGSPSEDLVVPVETNGRIASSDGAVMRVAPSVPSVQGAMASSDRAAAGTVTRFAPLGQGDRRRGDQDELRPELGSDSSLPHVIALFDTSASRDGSIATSAERLRAIAQQAGDVTLDVACFDQEIDPIYHGAARSFDVAKVLRREALGASDLGAALAWASRIAASRLAASRTEAPRAATHENGPTHVLVFTDATHPIGARTRAAMLPLIAELRASGAARIDFVLDRPHDGRFADLGVRIVERSISARTLLTHVSAGFGEVAIVGSRWQWPNRVGATFPGEEVVVFAEKKDSASSPSPLVTLGLAWAHLRDLAERRARATEANAAAALTAEIRAKSLGSGILTRETAFVVLETREDYEDARISAAERKVVAVGRDGAISARTRPPPKGAEGRGTVSVDRDADGIPDQVDKCPDEYDDDDSFDDGCPEIEGASRIIAGRPGLLRSAIKFGAKDATLSAPMRTLLDEIATALRQSPRIGLVEIAGHARASGAPAEAMRLSDARANAVRALLIEKGVSPERLVARPYGDRRSGTADDDRALLDLLMVDGKRRADPFAESRPPPHSGHFSEIAALIADKATERAIVRAREWLTRSGDVLAYVALGNALAAAGDEAKAARAYGSVLDLLPERHAEWRAVLGFLDRLGGRGAAIALDAHRRVHEERPTAYASARGLAYALARAKRWREAFETAMSAAHENGPSRTDAALLGAAWAHAEPKQRDAIEQRLVRAGIPIARTPSTQIVLMWESDATNVDLEIADARGGRAGPMHASRVLRSGGEYKLDVRTGYGPDWFSIDGRADAGPYRVSVAYGARGAMGPVMGRVSIVEHDGNGTLSFDERPFVLMNERAVLDVGRTVPVLARSKNRP